MKHTRGGRPLCRTVLLWLCDKYVALILLVRVQSRVFTAKCNESQADISNGMGGESSATKFLRIRTETLLGQVAKLQYKSKLEW